MGSKRARASPPSRRWQTAVSGLEIGTVRGSTPVVYLNASERHLVAERERVAQPAVVRGDDERPGPFRERGLEHLERGDVEVVRRLVEEEACRAPVAEHRQLRPSALAGRQGGGGPVGGVGAEAERGERRAGGALVEAGPGTDGGSERTLVGRERVALLAELRDHRARRDAAVPRGRLQRPGERGEQRRLAAAVRPVQEQAV